MATRAEIPIIMPAYCPDWHMIDVLQKLLALGFARVVVVDDGSGAPYAGFFRQAAALGCRVLHHQVNMGKGRALKTGFNYCLGEWPDAPGCVTADCDGQHTAQSIAAVANALLAAPHALVLGCRDFSGVHVPMHCRVGNRINGVMFRLLYGVHTNDTQTGLRAIPAPFMLYLLTVRGERFEFETNMLVETRGQEVPIVTVPTDTVFAQDGYSSNYRLVRDSLSIYKVLAKFVFSSMFATLVDFLLFTAFIRLLKSALPLYYIAASTALARICSATINYTINRRAVFNSAAGRRASIIKFVLLSLFIVTCSSVFVTLLHGRLGGSEVLWKAAVDICLFFVNFIMQREVVFRDKKRGRA